MRNLLGPPQALSLTVILHLLLCFSMTTQAASPASTLFKIPTSPAPGNCGNRDWNTVVTQASDMAKAAMTAIDAYLAATGTGASKQAYNTACTAEVLFGVKPAKFASVLGVRRVQATDAGKTALTTAKANYQKVHNLLNGNAAVRCAGNSDAVIICDDTDPKFLTWATHVYQMYSNYKKGTEEGDADLMQYQIKNGKTKADPATHKGYYVGTDFTPARIAIIDQGGHGTGLCEKTPTPGALTFSTGQFMVICPNTWSKALSIADKQANQGSIAKGTKITDFDTQGGVFLHEMFHMLDTATANGAKIIDGKVNGQTAYGWGGGFALASDVGTAAAITNADTYRWFAVASYLGDIYWGLTGTAGSDV